MAGTMGGSRRRRAISGASAKLLEVEIKDRHKVFPCSALERLAQLAEESVGK